MSANQVVAIAMSGGVDSSVAAALLVEMGEEVIGVMMRLWSDPDLPNRCCSPEDMDIARRVAAQLQIPFYVIDAQSIFKERVVGAFLKGYRQGITPNPCIECNRLVRWSFLLEAIRNLGADCMATGHYARVHWQGGYHRLFRAKDRHKDQSYVLSMLTQEQLSRARFPLAEWKKAEVRQLAKRFSLPIAERGESQDLCFLGGEDYYRYLLREAIPVPRPGVIYDLERNRIGTHQGLAAYTIGQRKRIGISGPSALYVIEKDIEQNALIVGPKDALKRSQFHVAQLNWIAGSPPGDRFRAQLQVRYRAQEVEAEISLIKDHEASIQLEKSLPDVTPGQYAVFYQGDECLGGGIIQL